MAVRQPMRFVIDIWIFWVLRNLTNVTRRTARCTGWSWFAEAYSAFEANGDFIAARGIERAAHALRTLTPLLITRRATPIAIRLARRSRPPALMPRGNDLPDIRVRKRRISLAGEGIEFTVRDLVSGSHARRKLAINGRVVAPALHRKHTNQRSEAGSATLASLSQITLDIFTSCDSGARKCSHQFCNLK